MSPTLDHSPTAEPKAHRTCIILSVGDELVLGQTLNTNSAWLSDVLAQRGIFALRHVTVDDDHQRLTRAINEAIDDADLVVITGGLGPTEDDLTREALCAATGDTLAEDAAALAALQAWFAGRTMPERNAVQALRPSRAICLPNANGTAPGIWLEHEQADICCLPGPPSEMHPMVLAELLPRLRPATTVLTRVLHTVGIGESPIAQRLGDLMRRERNPLVGTTASNGIVSVRLRWTGDDPAHGEQALTQIEQLVRSTLGRIIIEGGGDQKGIYALVGELIAQLNARKEMLSVCESCTAGLIASIIAEVPGSSAALAGGFVTYSNALKASLAGVDPKLIDTFGAVSREVAIAMASGTRQRTGTAHALSVTGIAGPGGGSETKPVGTVWIALDSQGSTPDARLFRFKGSREIVRQRAAVMALAMLRQRLLGIEDPLLAQVLA